MTYVGRQGFKTCPIGHHAVGLTGLSGNADGGVEVAEFLRLVLGFVQVADGAEAVGVLPHQTEVLKTGCRKGATAFMSKSDVFAAIGAAEKANPRLAQNRERVKAKARERKFDPELIAEEKRWSQFADTTEYMLAIYRHGSDIVVDVLRVNEAWVNERGKLLLGVEAPKVVKARHISDWLDWGRHFESARENLLHFEALHRAFHDQGNNAYRRVVERGLRLARKL